MKLKDFIFKNKIEWKKSFLYITYGNYLYFLIKENKIIYIGRTHYIARRLTKPNYKFDFDYFFFFNLKSKNKLYKKEKEYISKYKPKYNKQIYNICSKFVKKD